MKRILVLYSLMVVLGLFSYIKKPQKHPVYIDSNLKAFFGYKYGAYWVFYDSLLSSGIIR